MEPTVNGLSTATTVGLYVRREVASEGPLLGQGGTAVAFDTPGTTASVAGLGDAAPTLYRIAQVDGGGADGVSSATVSLQLAGAVQYDVSASADGVGAVTATALYIKIVAPSGTVAGQSSTTTNVETPDTTLVSAGAAGLANVAVSIVRQGVQELSASADGIADASSAGIDVTGEATLDVTADGVAATTVSMLVRVALSATAAGVSTVDTGTPATTRILDVSADGVGATALALARTTLISSSAAGSSDVALALVVVTPTGTARQIRAVVVGASGSTVASIAIRSVSARVDGFATVTVDVAVRHTLGVSVDGQATITVTTEPRRFVSATAAGLSGASATAHVERARVVSAVGTGSVALNVAVVRTMQVAAVGTALVGLGLADTEGAFTGGFADDHARMYADIAEAGA